MYTQFVVELESKGHLRDLSIDRIIMIINYNNNNNMLHLLLQWAILQSEFL
jgi:hypothetical protein